MAKKLWGGRFSKKINPLVEAFSSSIAVDKELAEFDVKGSLIHIAVLKEAKLLSAKEYTKIEKGLRVILKDILSGM